MNLIKKELIEEAFEKYNNKFFKSKEYYEKFKDDDYELGKHDFEKGVEFAESQLEELAIEFIEWAGNNRVSLSIKDQRNELQQVWYQGKNISAKELFQQFIKERNG